MEQTNMSEGDTAGPGLARRSSTGGSEPGTSQVAPTASSPPLPVSRRSSSVNEPPGFVRHQPVSKPPVDLRQVDYVSKVDDNLVCLICHCPFDTPLRVVACDHVFCKECLQHAFTAQESSLKTCPTCRSFIERDPEPVQRLLTRMLDELIIKCPNNGLGCDWKNKRIDVQDHIELYCDYTTVLCPNKHCDQEVMQKDFHKGCLHQTIVCQHCHTSMMKIDLENHERNDCPGRFAMCPHCSASITRCELPSHVKEECPKTMIKCLGHACGCLFEAERATVAEHAKECPMAIMAPTILAQKAKREEQDKAQRILQRKVDILEGGLSAVQSMLYTGNPTSMTAVPPMDPFTAGPAQPTEHAFPPIDPQAQQILSLHDSLREEVNRTANALADLDGRTNMLFLNEQQRNREEMLYLNSAIGTIRMQLHWLISNGRSQAYARSATATAQAPPGGLPSAAAPGASGSSSNAGAGRLEVIPPFRRLSDSTRQDTKL